MRQTQVGSPHPSLLFNPLLPAPTRHMTQFCPVRIQLEVDERFLWKCCCLGTSTVHFFSLCFSSEWILSAVIATFNCQRKANKTYRHQLWSHGTPESLWSAAYSQLLVMKKKSYFICLSHSSWSLCYFQPRQFLIAILFK